MRKNRRLQGIAAEAWAFVAIAIIAFVGGLLVGDLGASPETKTVFVSAPAGESETAAAPSGETGGEETAADETVSGSPGGQIFVSAGCGSCHTLAAAGSTGETGPDLNEFLAPDDTTEAVEEMIVDPNSELAEGYPGNVMPQTYSQSLSKPEVEELAEYLVETTPARP